MATNVNEPWADCDMLSEPKHKEEELMSLLSLDCFSDTPDLTEVNDLLWFEDEWIFEMLGIDTDSDDDEDDEEEDDDDVEEE